MSNLTEKFAQIDKFIRPAIYNFPGLFLSRVYSPGRKIFLKMLSGQSVKPLFIPPEYSKTIWGIKFNSSVYNAAGMFKKAEGYHVCHAQGAGAFLAGTSTNERREGNEIFGITHPFLPAPKSATAVNWMGLPNEGHNSIARKIAALEKKDGCPICVSIATDPDKKGEEATDGVIRGLELFENAGADFIEINESCPNVEHEHGNCNADGIDNTLIYRLEQIKSRFLDKRTRNFPVVLKFSNDTTLNQVEPLTKMLIDMGFDGINFGNTSIAYEEIEKFIHPDELEKFRNFTSKIGGGVSGRPLKEKSLELCKLAVKTRDSLNLNRDFAIIRTGGIENGADIIASEKAGIDLNQWFSGYFDAFAEYGNRLYLEILK
jgi:dihydroorotate dehydrogenase